MKLVIVESPTKAKTISRFLGKDSATADKFVIESSYGHVRDLPKSQLGVDVENNFTPKYIIPLKARKNVSALKQKAAKAEKIILATDEDREGEAIAWHLAQVLGFNTNQQISTNTTNKDLLHSDKFVDSHYERIVFHEITERAIKEALKNPRDLDMNLVDAQQARRILDRLVGYKLSPFLWKKIRSGLSAGRVQSVAVRLVVEREREIQKFVPQEYWSVEAELTKKSEDLPAGPPAGRAGKAGKKFKARLVKIGDEAVGRLDIKSAIEAKKITDQLEGADYKVIEVAKKEVRRAPAPPFTTSTLQQESAKKLGFSAKQTMILAQRLYETGFITYMRTDSLNIAESALAQAQEVIKNNFGKEYCLDKPRFYQNKSKGAQEAHEAVRPTDLSRMPENLNALDAGQLKLYDLIWKRTLACQMQVAILDQTAVDISAGQKFMFRANGQVIKFDGFIKVYTETKEEGDKDDDSDYEDGRLPELSADEPLDFIQLIKDQHFTEPPPRYTDASLIKTLESYGVGRPSTYAPTLATIQDRGYVEKEDKKYKPTEIGFSVNDMLVENFPEVIDINFTSHIEEEFDQIAEGKMGWVPVIQEFYAPFSKNLKEKMESVEQLTETSSTPCPHCGKMMLIKFGRLGKFLACPDPESKVTLPLPEEAAKIKQLQEKTAGELCPLCGKPLEVKRGRFGYFLGCVDYPKCKGIMKIHNKTGFKCPACGTGDIVEKKSRGRGRVFYACSRFPDCAFLMSKKPESQSELDEALKQWQSKPPKNKRK